MSNLDELLPQRFVKKPVEIEACKFTYPLTERFKNWIGDSLGAVKKARHPDAKAEAQILTLEDGKLEFRVEHIATEGDWIVKGVHGEFYPVKPDIFLETYVLAADDLRRN